MRKLILFLLLIVFISSCNTMDIIKDREYFIVDQVLPNYNNSTFLTKKYFISLSTDLMESNIYFVTNTRYVPGDTIYLTKQKL